MPPASQSKTLDPQLFSSVFKASPIGIVVENLEGQPLFVNPAFCSMLGFSEEEIRSKHCVDFSPPEDAAKDWELFQQLRAGAIDHYQLEKRYFRRDGSLLWGSLSISLLNSGPSPLVIAMVEDITEKKRAEEARFRHAAIVESSEDAIASATLDGVIVSWNAGAQRIYGYTEAEAVGKSVNILVPPELLDEENKILGRLRAGSRIEQFETVRVAKTGKRINVSVSISPIKDSTGATVGISGIARDITERKQAERELAQSNERLHLTLDVGRIGGWEWDIKSGQTFWFGQNYALLGARPGVDSASDQTFWDRVHPEDRDWLRDSLQKALQERLKSSVAEFRVVWPDQTVHCLRSEAQFFYGKDGQPERMLGISTDVTERKAAEAALRESEERLRLAVQAGKMFAYSWDAATDVIERSGEAGEILGLAPEEAATGAAISAMVHPDDKKRIEEALAKLTAENPILRITYRIIRPDGAVAWLERNSRAYFDEHGKVKRIVGMIVDATERKTAEDALRTSEQRLQEYERAVEASGEMITVLDREYRCVMANRQYLNRRNLTRDQVVGHFAYELVDDRMFQDVFKPKLDECLEGKVVKFELKYTYPELGERDLAISYFPIEGSKGVDRVTCLLLDITDRKKAEQALQHANRLLENQTALLQTREELLKTFVKNVPAPVAMLDREMRYLQVSDRWCTDYLSGREQVLGRSHYEIFPNMPERWKEVHRRGLRGETLRADEDRWDGQDGPHWARWEVRPWKTPEGTVGGILILAEDITHRKQMEDALSTMSRKLIEAQEQERARIARELHDDINQRLAMLAVELDQLQKDPSDLRSRAQELRKQVTEISNDVQMLSHDLHSSKMQYLGVVKGLKSWCREFAHRQKIEIDFRSDVAIALPFEIGLSILRVIQEALQNVVKHSGVSRVEVRLSEHSSEVRLTISDSGSGFDVEAAKQGQGLGLTSMSERVRLVNGTISIESKPTKGTTINVRVPLNSKDVYTKAV